MGRGMSWPKRALGYLELKPSLLIAVIALVLGYGFRLGYMRGLLVTAMIALSLLLHELGHVLIASAHGVKVKRIGLAVLGGYTVREFSGRRWVEAQSAVAGPLVNLLLFLVLISAEGPVAHAVARANLLLAVGNLIPLGRSDGRRLWKVISSWDSALASAPAKVAIQAEPPVLEAAGIGQKIPSKS